MTNSSIRSVPSGFPAMRSLQGLPLEQLHDDEWLDPRYSPIVVDRANVGMIQSRRGAGLALEALQRLASPVCQFLRAGTSAPRSDRAWCPRPCRPRPSPRHPAFPGPCSAKWFCQSTASQPYAIIIYSTIYTSFHSSLFYLFYSNTRVLIPLKETHIHVLYCDS